MPKRELEMSLLLNCASPPKTSWLWWLHAAAPHQNNAKTTGASTSTARAWRDRRRSSKPHSASKPVPSMPVREPLSTRPNSISSTAPRVTARAVRVAPAVSLNHTAAMTPHNNRLLMWLGWRMLLTARPAMPLGAIQLPSAHAGR